MSLRNQRYARAAAYKEQWGETLEDERAEAQRQMLREGRNPNAMSNKEWQLEKEERVKANRAARGPQAYDQAQGKLILSPRARAQANAMTQEKWDAQEETRIAQAAEDKKRQGVSAEDYWERNPESKRRAVVKDWSGDPEVAQAVATGESAKIEAAIKKAKARGGRTASVSADGEVTQTGNAGPRVRAVSVADLNEDMQADRLAQKTKRGEQQQKLAEFRQDMVEKRKENERVSRDRFEDFIVARDQREMDKAKSEAYLKNFDRQARAMRRAAIGNSYSGKEGAPGFWERNDEIQATAQNLRRMSQEERIKWANSQVKAEEEARAAQVATASKPSAVTEEELAEFFNRPVTLTDFINTFFGGGRK